MKKNEKKAKIYTNTKGHYFNVDKKRIYLHEVMKTDSKNYIGLYVISNCIVIYLIDIIYDINDYAIYTYSIM